MDVKKPDRGVRRACSVCGGSSAECLCCSQVHALLSIEDTDRGSGRVDECPTDSTVKQEALSREQWIRWSHGLAIDDDIEIMPIESRSDGQSAQKRSVGSRHD